MHNNNTCDMYMSSLRHIHNPVLLSLKMKGIRLLFYYSWGRTLVPFEWEAGWAPQMECFGEEKTLLPVSGV
jgi:hypothetical protein